MDNPTNNKLFEIVFLWHKYNEVVNLIKILSMVSRAKVVQCAIEI